jgi:thiol-disulfide isomerase/thioredoxin
VRNDLSGTSVSVQNYRGKVVLLNFWATWCSSCQVELPQFDAWQKKYGDGGLQIITVSMDDSEAPVRRTVRRLHLKLPVVMGDAKLGEAYGGVLGLPVTFLIDRKGTIVAQYKGETPPDIIEAEIDRILPSPK